MTASESTVVTVRIAGGDYTLRAHTTPEYTRQCAQYLDAMISEIRQHAGTLEMERVAILAGLALADQLFQARADLERGRRDVAQGAARLTEIIEERLAADGLAATS